MDKIAVLIPCYNESVTIEKVIKDWRKELPEATIYVYDNNSSDHTDQIAQNAGGVVRYEYRQGKGNVIRRMFREIDAEVYIMVDGGRYISCGIWKKDGRYDIETSCRYGSRGSSLFNIF